MRIPSGKTDQLIFFVGYDSADHTTRKTGLSGFSVYRSRNGGSATAYTTPTVTELSSANMPGVYALTVDEDTTIASTSDSEEYCVHITVSGMDPVTRTIELYRRDTTSGRTLDVSSGGEAGLDWANIGSQTTTVDLSGTTIKEVTDIDTKLGSPAGASVSADIATVASYIDTEVGAIKAKTDNLPASPAATSDIPSASTVAAAVWDLDATSHQTQGTFGQAIGDPGADTDTIFGLVNTNLDAAVSTRLASGSYTAPDNTSITAIKAKTDNLPSDPADASDISARFDTVDTNVSSIKTQTDKLTFTVANQIDANIQSVNDVTVTGTGASGDEWGP